MSRFAELARCRADQALDEAESRVWFGVGLTTLERVEAGEIEPGDELAERIDRFIKAFGGGLTSLSSAPSAPSPSNCGAPGGGGTASASAANSGAVA